MLYTYSTEHLTLKILCEDSAPIITEFFLQNREYFARWESDHPEEYYTELYQRQILSAESTQFLRSQAVRYYLFLPDLKIPIGTVCFQHIRPMPEASCQLGYRLDQSCTGKGYMTEALTCLIPKIFFFYRLHRIEANILPENTSSIRLVKRLGFTSEGTAREFFFCGGKFRDCSRYSLLSTDMFPRAFHRPNPIAPAVPLLKSNFHIPIPKNSSF